VISDVFKSVQGYLAIALHVPVFKGTEYNGSLAMLISIDKLGNLYLGKIKVSGTSNVWLLSKNGTEIYCSIPEHIGKSFLDNTIKDPTSYELLEMINNADNGTARSVHPGTTGSGTTRFNEQYVTFDRVSLGTTFWTIVMSYHEEDVYFALTRLRNRLILVFILLFIIISYYFYSLSKVRNVLKEEAKRKEAEKTLRESEEKFRRIFEDHTAVQLLCDPDSGVIIDANNSAAVFYGWSREELKRMKLDQLNILPPEEIKKETEKRRSQKRIQFEFRHRRKNGSIRHVEVFSSKIAIGSKEVLHSILHDITDRKQAEEEILNLNETLEHRVVERTNQLEILNKELNFHIQEIEQLTYIASHDLQEPLRTLSAFAKIINDEYHGKLDEEGNKYIEYISNSASRMRMLVTGILDYSLLGQKRILSVVDCDKIIHEVLFDMSDSIKSSGAGIMVKKLPVINGFETELRLLFQNLIHNAIKFRKRDVPPEIDISAEIQQHEWTFSIQDNGIGIHDNEKEHVFVIFRRTHNRSEYEGSGIGLAHCKKIVEMHDGRIWVESTPGLGSTFYFTIPHLNHL
jgi:PAS domain S-box-containing protein